MASAQVSKSRKVAQTVINVLVWVLLIIAALLTVLVFSSQSNNGIPNLFGKMPITILTDSMSPTFEPGDLIVCKKVDDIKTLKKDDVITFYSFSEGQKFINTHRIEEVKVNGDTYSFITKGDKYTEKDNKEVQNADIIGVYTGTHVPVLGKAIDFLKSSTGFFVCIVLPLLLLFLYQLYKLIVIVVESKHAKTAPARVVDEEEIKKKAIEEYLASQQANDKNEKKDNTEEDKADN